MSIHTFRTGLLAAGLVLASVSIGSAATQPAAPAMHDAILQVEHEWAHITYQVKDDDQKERMMNTLAEEAAKVVSNFPGRAEPLVWQAIVASSQARCAGAFSALGHAKQARKLLEDAGAIDFKTLGGAVPTSLGTIDFMVPGFPLGFGDNDKARQYFKQAMQINPNGLDANYFYGDFLYHEGEYRLASQVLKHALEAPVDPERPVWDSGRRAEAKALLQKVDDELASN
ncbi:MAG: tetratricopeptide repeat protein [Alphaproteobacteria bacterium]|nr:tetratricopeptide repeat protein [Alphaproteobacteria bacterium]MCB9930311.1 tetratricopeptide repeat protein [Alphaproteobacteria bacterium]